MSVSKPRDDDGAPYGYDTKGHSRGTMLQQVVSGGDAAQPLLADDSAAAGAAATTAKQTTSFPKAVFLLMNAILGSALGAVRATCACALHGLTCA